MYKYLFFPILIFVFSPCAFGVGADYAATESVQLAKAPAGLNALINTDHRVHGFFVNFQDTFFFTGNPSEFNEFIRDYMAMKGIAEHRLVIHPGKGIAKSPWNQDGGVACDWRLDVTLAANQVEVHVWTEGQIDLSKLKLPQGLKIAHKTKNPPGKDSLPAPRNNVYVKIILPSTSINTVKPPFVEAWIANKCRKQGGTKVRAVTDWICLGSSAKESTPVWNATLDSQQWGCPVHGKVERLAHGKIRVQLSGWSPGGAEIENNILSDEIGNRQIAVVDPGCETPDSMAYAALLIAPPAN